MGSALDALESRSLAGSEGAGFPFWSPDSRVVGFFAQGKLKKIDLAGGGPQILCDAPVGLGGTWSRDTSGSALEVGIPRPLFDVRIVNNFFQTAPITAAAKTPYPYVVSRDGQRFLFITDTSQQAVEPPITVVENWTAALKK